MKNAAPLATEPMTVPLIAATAAPTAAYFAYRTRRQKRKMVKYLKPLRIALVRRRAGCGPVFGSIMNRIVFFALSRDLVSRPGCCEAFATSVAGAVSLITMGVSEWKEALEGNWSTDGFRINLGLSCEELYNLKDQCQDLSCSGSTGEAFLTLLSFLRLSGSVCPVRTWWWSPTRCGNERLLAWP